MKKLRKSKNNIRYIENQKTNFTTTNMNTSNMNFYPVTLVSESE